MTCVVPATSLSNPARFFLRCARVAAVVTLALSPAAARAHGAVLRAPTSADPSTLDVELAVAVTPYGTTRWTRLTVAGPPSVLWLVPARPGAALDWATSGWLTTLEGATSPRVAPPTATPPCGMPATAERVRRWTASGVEKFPRAVVVLESAGTARSHVAARGFVMSRRRRREARRSLRARLRARLARARRRRRREHLVADAAHQRRRRAGRPARAHRQHEDAGARHRDRDRATAPPRSLVRATLDPSMVSWGRNYSSYAKARSSALFNGGGAIWMRESASHEVLFDGVAVPRDTPIQPLVERATFARRTDRRSRRATPQLATPRARRRRSDDRVPPARSLAFRVGPRARRRRRPSILLRSRVAPASTTSRSRSRARRRRRRS